MSREPPLTTCPLCKLLLGGAPTTLPHDDVHRFTCRRCGTFEVTGPGWILYENHPSRTLAANRYLLSSRARNAQLAGRVERFDVDDFAAAERGEVPEPGVYEKIDSLLAWIERSSPRFGGWVTAFAEFDYPVAYSHDAQEWNELARAAKEKGWLEIQSGPHSPQFRITLPGREHLTASRSLTKPPSKEPNVSDLPAHFAQHKADVDKFVKDAPFEESVFVMMKFPDRRTMKAPVVGMLDAIFKTIRDELARYGLTARRADDKVYATGKQLWDNLCVYMLGCKYGLAVLEDRSGEDFNPNVALEYGFMRALGRETSLVKERSFKYIRADVIATIPKEFSIGVLQDLDEASLRDAVEEWMIDLGRPARRRR